ncbi:putative GTP-binding protein C02F5.3 [Toxocara canis]|uniref:Putative GTP-binding protein C02F5.3 n=1 Tax=Toxocara canis TaxID=6265 RepID=A0A0B2URK0_TOXCA|nr:putative GTP-binding protein C02F5.3 [Toxocara canis]
MGILEKIQEIEREINRTQKNKATEYHLGLLKAKLARYRQQLLEPTTKGGSSKGEGFDVMKSGDARVAMVGFPSVGKSTLLSELTTTRSETAAYEFTTLTCIPGVIEHEGANIQLLDLPGIIEGASQGKGSPFPFCSLVGFPSVGKSTLLSELTTTRSETAAYEFTTLTCIPGVIEHEGANIQLLDLPGIIEGASQGKGRGRQVIAVAKTADLILMMLDAVKGEVQQKKIGGVKFTHTVPLTHCHEKLVMTILHDYKIFNADVVFRDDCTVDELIDVIQGNRVYIPCLYVYNKIDQISLEEVDRLAHQEHSIVISCEMRLNMDYMVEMIWEYLALIRIYTKKPGNPPDLGPTDGIILRRGASVEHACHALHRTLASQFRYAIVWGTSTKFSPQRVGIHHKLDHEDVVQIVKK